MISLKDFIKQTLRDIDEAKQEEKSFCGIRGVVDFDIATIADETEKAGIKVAVFGMGGELGGKLNNQIASRIKFSVQTKGAIAPSEK